MGSRFKPGKTKLVPTCRLSLSSLFLLKKLKPFISHIQAYYILNIHAVGVNSRYKRRGEIVWVEIERKSRITKLQ